MIHLILLNESLIWFSNLVGDQYRAKDFVVNEGGKFEIVFTPNNGSKETRTEVFNYPATGGCGMAMYNTRDVNLFDFLYKL